MRTALVIDSDPQSAKLVAVLLESDDWRVQIAHTTEDAHRLLAAALPDAILIELMPLPARLRFLEAVRSEPATRSIPIVVVSSFNGNDVERVIVEAGARGYFRKPLDVSTFAANLNVMLGGKP